MFEHEGTNMLKTQPMTTMGLRSTWYVNYLVTLPFYVSYLTLITWGRYLSSSSSKLGCKPEDRSCVHKRKPRWPRVSAPGPVGGTWITILPKGKLDRVRSVGRIRNCIWNSPFFLWEARMWVPHVHGVCLLSPDEVLLKTFFRASHSSLTVAGAPSAVGGRDGACHRDVCFYGVFIMSLRADSVHLKCSLTSPHDRAVSKPSFSKK